MADGEPMVTLDGALLAVTRQPYDENGNEVVEMGGEHDCW